jgi:hypothetical protein
MLKWQGDDDDVDDEVRTIAVSDPCDSSILYLTIFPPDSVFIVLPSNQQWGAGGGGVQEIDGQWDTYR